MISKKTTHFTIAANKGDINVLCNRSLKAYHRNKEYFGNTINYFSIEVYEPPIDEPATWLIGTPGKGTIPLYIRGPAFLKRTRNLDMQDWEDLMTHEMCHRFADEHLSEHPPRWFYEGLAGHIGKQVSEYTKGIKIGRILISDMHSFEDFHRGRYYTRAFALVHLMHEQFDKNTVKKVYAACRRGDTHDDFNKRCMTHLGITIEALEKEWNQLLGL